MNRPWEEALRSLARRPQSRFRVLAVGVAATPEEEPIRKSELAAQLRDEGFGTESEIYVEIDASGAGAATRPSFHGRVLDWIESSPRPPSEPRPEGRGIATEEARRRLHELTTELDRFLVGEEAGPVSADLGAESAAVPGPKAAPLVLVGRLGDLGSDAEGI